jgi:hypothetical protein
MHAALEYHKRALTLARFDPELEETVSRIAREIGAVATPPGPSSASSGAPAAADSQGIADAFRAADPPSAPSTPSPRPDLIDFDALLASLGVPDASPPPLMDMLLPRAAGEGTGREIAGPTDLQSGGEGTGHEFAGPQAAPVLDGTRAPMPPAEGFAELERELRSLNTPPVEPQSQDAAVAAVVEELQSWLRVLQRERAPEGA